MKHLKTGLLTLAAIVVISLMACEEKDCPDGMVKCDNGQGGTVCVPESVGC